MDLFTLGQQLRDKRESQGIDLPEAVRVLRIRQPILEGFEAGDFNAPNLSDNQIRGMLRNYARYLGLDEEHILRLFDDARSQTSARGRWRRRGNQPTPDSASSSPPPMQEIVIEERRAGCRSRLWRSCLLLLLSLLALVIIAFVTLDLIETDSLSAEASPAAIDNQISPTAQPTPTAIPPSPTPSDRAQYSGIGLFASIRLTQRSWIQIVADGVEQYAGIAAPNTLLEYDAVSEIRLRASNALSLDIYWNGQRQPIFGGRGQGIDIRFSVDDIRVELGPAGAPTLIQPTNRATALAAMTSAALTPSVTPGPSPTPTPTPIPSATWTLTPAPTLTPSNTPTITLTPTASAILPPRITQAGLIPTKVGA